MGDHDATSNLQSTWAVLDPRLEATLLPVTDTVWADIDRRYGDFAGHSLVAAFSFSADWPTWEMHPRGDEIVCLVSGRADLSLRDAAGERSVALREPGDFAVVPRGTWHTAAVRGTTVMLFVTPGEGTENRAEPGI